LIKSGFTLLRGKAVHFLARRSAFFAFPKDRFFVEKLLILCTEAFKTFSPAACSAGISAGLRIVPCHVRLKM
jgi:hypothetical protein